ncbi:serine hydrolase domain-containing protein [Salsipaludibacter albus]|uniref:serine hydrolase domain-containing protein n=1 Tax=Salsipaludibacter albus TaxID=2849650 RepID=UPI001EE3FAF0|nr:serine hydrolase domain-containing protein [Salsipaludibacter albus]MBY5160891.1 beta-lactamase family protein [Salsipaludibacter albus]
MEPDPMRRLDARLARAQRDARVPSLAAGVVLDGHLAWAGGAGHVDGRPGGAAPDETTAYRIGSITKTFTAVLVLQERDAGGLDLDDPVGDHLGDLDGHPVGDLRLAELLCHGSGLRAEPAPPWWERAPGRSWDELLPDLLAAGSCPAPRGTFHYSNVGYAVLGRVLATRSGRSWDELLADRLLAPLGMDRTTRMRSDPSARPLAVHPHREVLLEEPDVDTGAMAPAGQSWSTVADLGRWCAFLADPDPDVLAPATLAEMARPRTVALLDPPLAHGLGLQVVHRDGRTMVGHGGSIPGFVATLFVDRDDHAGVVVLGNATHGFDGELATDLVRLARSVVPRTGPTWTAQSDTTPVDELVGDLVGTWYWGPRPLTVRAEAGGRLVVDLGQATRDTVLDHVADERWIGRGGYWDGEPARVVRDDDGRVSHLDLGSFALTRHPYAPAGAVPGGRSGDWGDPDR